METQPSKTASSPERMKKPKVRKFGRGATFLECHEGTEQSEARIDAVFSAMLSLAGSRSSMASGSRRQEPSSFHTRFRAPPHFSVQPRT